LLEIGGLDGRMGTLLSWICCQLLTREKLLDVAYGRRDQDPALHLEV